LSPHLFCGRPSDSQRRAWAIVAHLDAQVVQLVETFWPGQANLEPHNLVFVRATIQRFQTECKFRCQCVMPLFFQELSGSARLNRL